MRKDCPFCSPRDIRFENELAFAIFDRNPVQKGHMLIIPRRHFADYFEATAAEVTACHELIRRARIQLDPEYHPDAYNIGINIGRAAGQSIDHAHIHLIPRYRGDVRRAKGGVRGVIPDRQDY